VNCPMCGTNQPKLRAMPVKTDNGMLKIPMCDECITKRMGKDNEQAE